MRQLVVGWVVRQSEDGWISKSPGTLSFRQFEGVIYLESGLVSQLMDW